MKNKCVNSIDAVATRYGRYRHNPKDCLSRHKTKNGKPLHTSRWEAKYCDRLLSDKQARRIKDYKVQVTFELYAGIKHVVDFVVYNYPLPGNALVEVHEAKGFQTPEWRLKKKMFEKKYPDFPYRVVTEKEERRKKWIELEKRKVKVFK